MSVPDFQSLMLPVLSHLSDGAVHGAREVFNGVAATLGLSPVDLEELLPSGKQTRYENRILWALHYLKRAQVVTAPARGKYAITDRGRELLDEKPPAIGMKTLERYPEYLEFVARGTSGEKKVIEPVIDEASTPEERLEAAFAELQARVAVDVLDRLRSMDPIRFESVVLEVLIAMGYGGSDPERASLTARSHDGGLDGVINEDELGLDRVVVQAKRYNSPVDVKLVREFAGSLDEHGTDKGVFFTTDKFTTPATDYVKSIKKRIILIDGVELARLMVRFGVGVSAAKVLSVPRIDSDFFDDPEA